VISSLQAIVLVDTPRRCVEIFISAEFYRLIHAFNVNV